MYSGRYRRRSEVSKTPSAVFEAKQSRVSSSPTRSNFHMLTRAQRRRARTTSNTADCVSARSARSAYNSPRSSCRRAESSACGVMRTSIRQPVATRCTAAAPLGYAVPFRREDRDAESRVTAESLHRRQADCLPGRFGLVVTRIAEGRLDAELTIEPWMLAPNGYLHAASVLLLADTSAGYASFAHLPEKAKNFTTIELKSNFLGTDARGHDPLRVRRRAPRPDDARLVGDGVRPRRQAHRALSLHAADPVVKRAGRAGVAPRRPRRRARCRHRSATARSRRCRRFSTRCRRRSSRSTSRRSTASCAASSSSRRRSRRRRWLRFVTDVDGRALPAGFDARPLHALVLRRDAELRRAIGRREWFDPWVFELDDDATARTPRRRRRRGAQRSRLPVGRRLRRCARDLPRPARRRRRRAHRPAGAPLPPSRRRRPRGRRRAARRDRDRSSRRPTSLTPSRSSFARRCCSPTSARSSAGAERSRSTAVVELARRRRRACRRSAHQSQPPSRAPTVFRLGPAGVAADVDAAEDANAAAADEQVLRRRR